jgi:predicted metalloendopeptidase
VEDLWKSCISETDDAVGMALGNLFVKDKFEGSSREEVRETFKNVFGCKLKVSNSQ